MQERISKLKELFKHKFPQMINVFNTSASEDELNKLETLLGVSLPSDFRSFYSCHNGQQEIQLSLFDLDYLLSIEHIISEWQAWADIMPTIQQNSLREFGLPQTSSPEKGIKDDWWNKKWIPITSNGCGDSYCIDLDPTEQGNVGQIIRMYHDDPLRELIANSFQEWIDAYINDIENDMYEFSGSLSYGGLALK